jgi:hypothetical protein
MDNFLSTNLNLPSLIPYFLWDASVTVAELKRKLNSATAEARRRLLGKIWREVQLISEPVGVNLKLNKSINSNHN